MKKVSLIIPVYNIELYLKRCLDSILNQRYKNLEIILINDGSTDGSLKLCQEYQKKDSRIILIDKKNEGVSSARNKGLEIASGDYIGFIDSDDWIDIDMIETLVNSIEKYRCDISISSIYINNDSYSTKDKITKLNKEKCIKLCLELENPVLMAGVCNKLFKSHLIRNMKFDVDLHIGEDMLFLIKALLKTENIIFIEKSLYHYFQRENSVTHYFSLKKLSNIKSHERLMKEFFNNKELVDFTKKRLVKECLNMLRSCMNEKIKDKDVIFLLQKNVKKYKNFKLNIKERLLSYNYITFLFMMYLKRLKK